MAKEVINSPNTWVFKKFWITKKFWKRTRWAPAPPLSARAPRPNLVTSTYENRAWLVPRRSDVKPYFRWRHLCDVIKYTSLRLWRHYVYVIEWCFFFFLALLARSLQLAPTRAGPAGAHSSLSIRAGGRTLVELLNFCVVLQQSQAENIFCSLHNRCLAALFFLVLRGLHLII